MFSLKGEVLVQTNVNVNVIRTMAVVDIVFKLGK
jgi:hypothetical protein